MTASAVSAGAAFGTAVAAGTLTLAGTSTREELTDLFWDADAAAAPWLDATDTALAATICATSAGGAGDSTGPGLVSATAGVATAAAGASPSAGSGATAGRGGKNVSGST